jgi:hypothetical protein
LVQGSTTVGYSTISKSAMLSFRALLGVISADELGPKSGVFLFLFIFFFLVCACLMFNVFPSVLDVAYDKAMRTPHYDTDALSLWLILKPILRRVKVIDDPIQRQLESEELRKALAESKGKGLEQPLNPDSAAGGADGDAAADPLPMDAVELTESHLDQEQRDPFEEERELQLARMAALQSRMQSMSTALEAMFADLNTQVSQLSTQVEQLSVLVPNLVLDSTSSKSLSDLGPRFQLPLQSNSMDEEMLLVVPEPHQ